MGLFFYGKSAVSAENGFKPGENGRQKTGGQEKENKLFFLRKQRGERAEQKDENPTGNQGKICRAGKNFSPMEDEKERKQQKKG